MQRIFYFGKTVWKKIYIVIGIIYEESHINFVEYVNKYKSIE